LTDQQFTLTSATSASITISSQEAAALLLELATALGFTLTPVTPPPVVPPAA